MLCAGARLCDCLGGLEGTSGNKVVVETSPPPFPALYMEMKYAKLSRKSKPQPRPRGKVAPAQTQRRSHDHLNIPMCIYYRRDGP